MAARHSQQVGILRYFARAFVDPSHGWPSISASADGLVAYLLEAPDTLPPADKPIVAAILNDPGQLAAAALEAAVCAETLSAAAGDNVARREMEERLAVAVRAARTAAEELFRPGRSGVTWRVVGADEVLTSVTGVSRLLSDVCDATYSKSPELRTETLARRELTSQGAKARRILLEAMVDNPTTERLAIVGYGPERAMYEAMLHHPGIHRPRSDGGWSFGRPKRSSTLTPAWAALERLLISTRKEPVGADEAHRLLSSAPFGIPQGPIPVLLVAMLLAHSDELAIYFDDTYQPHLSAEMVERLVKAPDRFAIKCFAATGIRAVVIGSLTEALGIAPPSAGRRRNPTLLHAVAPLIGTLREQPEYALRTTLLSTDAIAVREALRSAREPDGLLFQQLPVACGVPVPLTDRSTAARFVERLTTALEEFKQAYPRLLETAQATIVTAFELPENLGEARSDLGARARRLVGSVLDPRLRSFLTVAADIVLDDESWLEAILLTAAGRPPKSWRDDDRRRFELSIADMAGVLRRVEALHFEALADDGGDGFEARRVTVTAPSGEETSSVFWVDHSSIGPVTEAADRALEDLEALLGARALPALLAILAGRACTTPPATVAHDPNPEQEQRRA